jgi:hypothetical protein
MDIKYHGDGAMRIHWDHQEIPVLSIEEEPREDCVDADTYEQLSVGRTNDLRLSSILL